MKSIQFAIDDKLSLKDAIKETRRKRKEPKSQYDLDKNILKEALKVFASNKTDQSTVFTVEEIVLIAKKFKVSKEYVRDVIRSVELTLSPSEITTATQTKYKVLTFGK